MSRVSLLKLFVAIVFVCCLNGNSAPLVHAQDQAAAAQEGTATTDQEVTATGLLQLSAVSCTAGGEPGTVAILLASEFAPSGECLDSSISILIDGVDYGPVAPYLELSLDAGFHNLYEPNTGAARDVEVLPDSATHVIVVRFDAPAETPTAEPTVAPAETVATGLTVVAHSCKPDIQSVDQLWGLGGRLDRLNACPAMTLSGYPSPGGTANGGELYFDFSLTPATGETLSLSGNGSFVSDAFCESSVGALDNDPTNDRCVSTSGFSFQLPQGASTLTLTAVPDLMRYVAAETGSDEDAAVITGSDPASWYVGIDTSLRGTEQPVIHLYFLNPPRVNVVMHLCGSDVSSPDALAALGSLAGQILTCPATARFAEGGGADFGVSVSDGNWGTRGLDSAIFDPTLTCEADIGDWNGDGGDNACVDAPTYRFDQTAQGYVGVTQDYLPEGYVLGGANSPDPGVISGVDLASWTVSLDTSFDGDVTLHLFAILEATPATSTSVPTVPSTQTSTPQPSATATSTATTQPATATRTATVTPATSTPTPTAILPTPTEEAGSTTGNGTLTVVALYCLTASGTSVVALPPGVAASASDLGGSSCFAGDASVVIAYANGESLPAFKLGRDGVEAIQNIPATSGGLHTLSEQLTGQSTAFAIDPGTVTRVIIKYGAGTAMIEEGVTSSSTGANGAGGSGSTGSTSGMVTDELIGDEGALFGASFANISYTSLVVEDVDAKAVASVQDARSLPGVGVWPHGSTGQTLAMLLALGSLAAALAMRTRRHSHC